MWWRPLEGTNESHLDISADTFVDSWGLHMGQAMKFLRYDTIQYNDTIQSQVNEKYSLSYLFTVSR